MRLVVHSASLAVAPRMRSAAWALAERGHDVAWLGGAAPDGARFERMPPAMRRLRRPAEARRADVVIGGATHSARVAWAGWLAGAHAAAIALEGGRPPSLLGRAIWETFDHHAFAGSQEGAESSSHAAGWDRDGLVAWSDASPPAEPDATHADVEILERACERLAARRAGPAPRPAVFLDRDGTLVVERGYLSRASDLELLPGVPAALRELSGAGYALVVVSNQSGVGRGLFSLSRVYEAMARLRQELRARDVELDAIYFCPHRPDEGCECRKPSPELLHRAARSLRLTLRDSAMVGDKLLDVETGRRAGVRAVLVRTGYGRDEERGLETEGAPSAPDLVADDLTDAAAWLLALR